ncbi:unnamed protein product [Urochloa decumbens]|uniref:Phosphatidic acid phosphatase type 2/haloperoxidase domain-containing protein n=2 Tax=Urochloa decumbens TaxID=240449 RepID=A0ABC9EAD1_9POAL
MPCSLQLPSPCPWPHLILTSPSCRHRQCKEHVLMLPLRRSRVRLGVRMAEIARVVGVSAEGDATKARDEPRKPSQEADSWAPVEAALNWSSKWMVAGSYVFAVVWKHDVEIMWVLLGASANYLLSLILKRMLNHERPAPDLRSDPGMPSSHAQSICYAATLLVLSLYYCLGTNYLTMIIGPTALSMATYLSWLRVPRRLHTLNQVMAGAGLGSAFGALWFLLWRSLVQGTLASSLSNQIVVVLGSTASCVAVAIYVSGHWLKNE